jgi:DNA-binding NarL/FixJ family response regulator
MSAIPSPTLDREVLLASFEAAVASAMRPAALAPVPALDELTDRERDVLRLIARGLTNAEIADELIVSGATVKTHVARVLMKLGVPTRVRAVVLAYESGFVLPGAAV